MQYCICKYRKFAKLKKKKFSAVSTGFGMDTQERLNKQAQAQEWMTTGQRHSNPVILVLLVTLGSVMVGLIPFAHALTFGKAQSQNPTTLTAGEAALWSVFEEKNTSRDGSN